MPAEKKRPVDYQIDHFTITPVSCAFRASGQYQMTSRYLCFLLLIITAIIRDHEWLAAGAAASVLTYSGVAAVHMTILFATNNRFDLSERKTRCETVQLPRSDSPFLACRGVYYPDGGATFEIVSTCLLAALPIAAWSTTFRSSTRKPILLLWLLLLAFAHVFFNITNTDVNPHFQICPSSSIEPLPLGTYQARSLNNEWKDSLLSLVKSYNLPGGAVQPLDNGSFPPCLFSCFDTTAYTGRTSQDIGVYDIVISDLGSRLHSQQRLRGILVWSTYTFLAVLTLFTTAKKDRLPQWAHKKHVFTFSFKRRLLRTLILRSARYTRMTSYRKRDDDEAIIANAVVHFNPIHHTGKFEINILTCIQLITQLFSTAAFLGSIITGEINMAYTMPLEAEPVSAVGQWGSVVVVLLVLIAAGVSKLWKREDEKSGNFNVISPVSGDEDEKRENDWNCDVGYTS